MVRAHSSLRIPGPERLPLRLQHLWEDVAEWPTCPPSASELRGQLERLSIACDRGDAPARDRRGQMTVA